MGDLKRYLGMVFGGDIKELLPVVKKYVNVDTPYYQVLSLQNSNATFISFYSKRTLKTIKKDIKASNDALVYMFFDITNRGEHFEINGGEIETLILLENDDIVEKNNMGNETNLNLDDEMLDLDILLDLINKNGWASLTEKQKKRIIEISNG